MQKTRRFKLKHAYCRLTLHNCITMHGTTNINFANVCRILTSLCCRPPRETTAVTSGTQTGTGTIDVSYNYCKLLGFNIGDMPGSIGTSISNSYVYWLLYFLMAKTGILSLNRPRSQPFLCFCFTIHVHSTLDC